MPRVDKPARGAAAGSSGSRVLANRTTILVVRFLGPPPSWERTAGTVVTEDGGARRVNASRHRRWIRRAVKQIHAEILPAYRELRYAHAVRLDGTAIFRRPKGHKGAVINARYPRPVVPDRDNVEKIVADALQAAGVIDNDCRITEGEIKKVYGRVGEGPSLFIKLVAVDEMQPVRCIDEAP